MASFYTNKGLYRIQQIVFRGATPPTNFYVALVSDAPTVDTNTLGELTQIPNGNGYTTGGIQITRGDGSSGVGFDVLTEDDSGNRSFTQLEDLVWTASGGPIPASGSGALWAVLTDDNATMADREVWAAFELVSARTVSDGQPLTLQNAELRLVN